MRMMVGNREKRKEERSGGFFNVSVSMHVHVQLRQLLSKGVAVMS